MMRMRRSYSSTRTIQCYRCHPCLVVINIELRDLNREIQRYKKEPLDQQTYQTQAGRTSLIEANPRVAINTTYTDRILLNL